MSYVRRFVRFWWNFIVGDDLPLALGTGAVIGLTAFLVDLGVNAWWLLPTSILALLAASVVRVANAADGPEPRFGWRDRAALRRLKQTVFETRDERNSLSRAPQTIAADVKTTRIAGEGSKRDVEQLGD